ncbi:hypothetical protein Enr13x_14680 [Stieleria neptunia]|uniref:Uncharacterized protein n=1 Tax=Stieleria neptunia TaxID=2527979 RepID=A0A518HL91_9BACT|nr:hypothetical protein Enr13x_14680 [Stieleria neptunia]
MWDDCGRRRWPVAGRIRPTQAKPCPPRSLSTDICPPTPVSWHLSPGTSVWFGGRWSPIRKTAYVEALQWLKFGCERNHLPEPRFHQMDPFSQPACVL